MAAFENYHDLALGLAAYVKKNDFVEVLDRLTAMAEARLNRELRVSDMEALVPLTTDTDGEVALPADFLQASFMSDSTGCLLDPVSQISLVRHYISGSGRPAGYSIVGATLRVGPVAVGTFDFSYYQALPPLETNGTNWLLARAPDVYLYAVAREIAVWQRDVGLASASQELLAQAVNSLRLDDDARRNTDVRVIRSEYTP